MTYFGFLVRFLILPILLLALLHWRDRRAGKELPVALQAATPWKVLALLVLIAVVYTTPWDNYLVATSVWWYDVERVTGIVLGWVPIEEYTFFVLQPILVGLWLLWLARRITPSATIPPSWTRWLLVAPVAVLWVISLALLVGDNAHATYAALELSWALPPILLQLVFGGDILLRHWKLTLATILAAVAYLALVDTLAISSGIWMIDPAQSFPLLIGGRLPIEELIFFALTSSLVAIGLLLGIAQESWVRLRALAASPRASRSS